MKIVRTNNCVSEKLFYNMLYGKFRNSLSIIHKKEGFVQFQMENGNEFMIQLGCVRDVEDFVSLSTVKSFPVYLDDGRHQVNGKSFMEMFCLDITHPLRVTAQCSETELQEFRWEAAQFLIP